MKTYKDDTKGWVRDKYGAYWRHIGGGATRNRSEAVLHRWGDVKDHFPSAHLSFIPWHTGVIEGGINEVLTAIGDVIETVAYSVTLSVITTTVYMSVALCFDDAIAQYLTSKYGMPLINLTWDDWVVFYNILLVWSIITYKPKTNEKKEVRK